MDDEDMRRAALRDDALSLASLAHGNPWHEYERLKRIFRARNPQANQADVRYCNQLLYRTLGL